MLAVAVSALDEQDVARRQRLGIGQDRSRATTEIAGKKNRLAATLAGQDDLDHRRSEDVAGRIETQRQVGVHLDRVVKGNGLQALQGLHGLGLGVQRRGRIVLAVVPLVGPASVFFLKIAGVGQQDAAQRAGRVGC